MKNRNKAFKMISWVQAWSKFNLILKPQDVRCRTILVNLARSMKKRKRKIFQRRGPRWRTMLMANKIKDLLTMKKQDMMNS